MTAANKITVTRILLIPLFVMMAIYYGKSVQRGHRVQSMARVPRPVPVTVYVVSPYWLSLSFAKMSSARFR